MLKSRIARSHVFGVLVFAASFSSPDATMAADAIAAKNNNDNVTYFRRAVQQNDTDALLHYKLANALASAGKHSEALAEYTRSYKLDSFGPASGYCRKAFLAYHVKPPEADNESAVEPPSEPISALSRITTYNQSPDKHAGTINVIRAQAESEKSRHKLVADTMANQITSLAETKARRIEEDAKLQVDALLAQPILQGRGVNPIAVAEMRRVQADNMKKLADESAKAERATAAEKSSSYKRWSEERSVELDHVAANLEHQLIAKSLPGSARLREEGTGLFVRYYGSDAGPIPEVHNAVARIIKPQTVSVLDQGEADEEEQHSASDPKGSSVRGAVIKQYH